MDDFLLRAADMVLGEMSFEGTLRGSIEDREIGDREGAVSVFSNSDERSFNYVFGFLALYGLIGEGAGLENDLEGKRAPEDFVTLGRLGDGLIQAIEGIEPCGLGVRPETGVGVREETA